ncbi:hypothetical protein [Chitinibacter sp. ZOR0017]|uniref:hypothetical protein n=1 Tax=Chitinibacter sp. ZOR0017 TaxID=1339254 RepID=UPI0012DFFEF0|nr:hypothetical protein [Chitinibacter sp. ZOR0017]
MKNRIYLGICLYLGIFILLFLPALFKIYLLEYPPRESWEVKEGKIDVFMGVVGHRGKGSGRAVSYRLQKSKEKTPALGCIAPLLMFNCGLSDSEVSRLDGQDAKIYFLYESSIAELIIGGKKIISEQDTRRLFALKKRAELLDISRKIFIYSVLFILVWVLLNKAKIGYKS